MTDIDASPVAPKKSNWTPAEDLILATNYPLGGVRACRSSLPKRTVAAIQTRAKRKNIQLNEGVHGEITRRYAPNAGIDLLIKNAYLNPKVGIIKSLSRSTGRATTWIANRAVELGCGSVLVARWSEKEREIIVQMAGKQSPHIQRVLKSKGFTRTKFAINRELRRLEIFRDMNDPNLFSIEQVAAVFGIARNKVTSWIEKGLLKAKKQGAYQTATVEITRLDLYRFVRANPMAFDIRRVDQVWFMDFVFHVPSGFSGKKAPALANGASHPALPAKDDAPFLLGVSE